MARRRYSNYQQIVGYSHVFLFNSAPKRYNAMNLKWTDTKDLALALDAAYPEIDPRYVNFVDLRDWVLNLPGFADRSERSGEKVLEAIQMAWIEERE
jgi:FeS assembly protein IscX